MNQPLNPALPLTDDARLSDYLACMKPRVMSLVVFTALVGVLMADPNIHPVLMAASVLLIATGAGASASLNMWYESDIDALMQRTASRPIPSGRVAREEVLTLGVSLAAASVFGLAMLINYLSAALLAFTIIFYAVFYTIFLKRRTAQNIVIGGAAGALPPVIGWAAATGGLTLEPLLMFLIIFLWTPPHFWALALIKQEDYIRANIPMLPIVAGERATLWNIWGYSVALVAASCLPFYFGFSGTLYMQVAAASGAGFIALATILLAAPAKHKWAGRLFAYSIAYLFIIFVALLADRLGA